MNRGPQLRAVANRKFSSACDYHINQDRNCILVLEHEATDAEGKPRKVLQPDTTVTLRALAPIRMQEVVGFLRANPKLYTLGYVAGMLPLVSPSDDYVLVEFEYTAKERTDLSKLEYLFEIYIGE